MAAKSTNKVREWLNKNSAIVTILAVVLLLVSLGAIILQGRTDIPGTVDVYYYDLNTGQLFSGAADLIPPIKSPLSGPTENGMPPGVRAYVFSCGECGVDEQFIGWLEMFHPEVQQMMEQMRNPDAAAEFTAEQEYEMMEAWENGRLLRPIDGAEWIEANSEQAMLIQEQVHTRCGEDTLPEPCLPNMEN